MLVLSSIWKRRKREKTDEKPISDRHAVRSHAPSPTSPYTRAVDCRASNLNALMIVRLFPGDSMHATLFVEG